jgi:tubulin-folding cofactor B
VIDRSGAQSGEFSDLSKVEKFEIPDEVYEKRTGTVSLHHHSQLMRTFEIESEAVKKRLVESQLTLSSATTDN